MSVFCALALESWKDVPQGDSNLMRPDHELAFIPSSTNVEIRLIQPEVAGQADTFRFRVEGSVGKLVQIETSRDLRNWAPLEPSTTYLPGDWIVDLNPYLRSHHSFYRAVILTDDPPIVELADLTNLSLEEAERALDDQGLVLGEVESVIRITSPAVAVLEQNPPPGASLFAGDAVNLRVSFPDDPRLFLDLFQERVDENDLTAIAYYAAIDPNNERDTLENWLKVNNIHDPGDVSAEAVYFNGGDLGFGRRMLMSQNPQGMFFWVHNYRSVEDAAEDVELLATVAMEYSPHPVNGGTPYVKFHTFDGNGDRILKIDLDGRGEKSVPGMCTTCHGGQPLELDNGFYPNEGRIGTRFIPFDLDTFEYSTAHPEFSRANQEDEFKILNAAVLEHYEPRPVRRSVFYRGPSRRIPSDGNFAILRLPVQGLGPVLQDVNFRLDGENRNESYPNSGTDGRNSLTTFGALNGLEILLRSPSGTQRTLMSPGNLAIDLAVNGQAISSLTFDDEAPKSLSELVLPLPVEESTRPQQALSAFDGEDPNGTWQIWVRTVPPRSNLAWINRWSLHFNQVVGLPNSSAAVELIEGWYGGSDLPNDTQDGGFVPSGWLPPHAPANAVDFYLGAYKFGCRSCHIQQSERNPWIDFATYDHFASLRDKVAEAICDEGRMPAARRTFNNFWLNTRPAMSRQLENFMRTVLQFAEVDLQLPDNISAHLNDFNSLTVDPHNGELAYVILQTQRISTNPNLSIDALPETTIRSSRDGGTTWEDVARFPSELPGTIKAVRLGQSTVLFLVTDRDLDPFNATADWTFRFSLDGGITWTEQEGIGLPDVRNSRGVILAVSPSAIATIFLGINGKGLFRTVDFGRNWEEVLLRSVGSEVGAQFITDIEFDPNSNARLFVASSSKIFTTEDTGDSWNVLNSGNSFGFVNRSHLAVASDALYFSPSLGRDGVFRSRDGGNTFEQMVSGFPSIEEGVLSGYGITDLELDPASGFLYALEPGLPGVVRSRDGGNTWEYLAGDKQAYALMDMTISPSLPTHIYATGNGRLYRDRGVACDGSGPGRPIAKITATRRATIDTEVRLNGQGSLFAKTFAWRVVAHPPSSDGSDVQLVGASTVTPRLRASTPGRYILGLRVGTGSLESEEAQFAIELIQNLEDPQDPLPLSFKTDILPIFNDTGCSGCHRGDGAPGGLSLNGGADAIYREIAIESGRENNPNPRLIPGQPDQSLLVRKTSDPAVPHTGQKPLAPPSDELNILKRWIAEGAPNN